METNSSKIHLAVIAGIFATTGSLLGKLAGNVDGTSLLFLLLKLLLLVLMVTSNTAGCTFFVKSLQGNGSSLPATVASAATNYFCSVTSIKLTSQQPIQFNPRQVVDRSGLL
ncbi:uncharacterized protein LOC107267886 isoform X1 [Cephus cinctus]|uniref:Uncharacterized protein LOC107267886 isoform X1 n=1 Tax=Cephus cinctus TaxID=211228 RepID=A0AAJ7BVN3_CEPCN|nr:uncharacterized protein LOC107267886 isoform X1 [Cephus cinctus]